MTMNTILHLTIRLEAPGTHRRQADLALPAHSSVAEILGEVLALLHAPSISAPWQPTTTAGTVLDATAPLSALPLTHGDILVLRPFADTPEPLVVDTAEALVSVPLPHPATQLSAAATGAGLVGFVWWCWTLPHHQWLAFASGALACVTLLALATRFALSSPVSRWVLASGTPIPAGCAAWTYVTSGDDGRGALLVAGLTAVAAMACACVAVKQFDREGYQPGVLEQFHRAVAQLEQQGAEVVEVDCPHFDDALAAYYLILPCEVSSNLARFDGMRYGLRVGDDGSRSADEVMAMTRAAGFGPEVKRRIILGTYALSVGYYDAYYLQAQRVRTLIARDFANAYEHCDVLISPTTPTTAFKLGEKVSDPLAMYNFDLCTLPLNLAGLCGMSLPAGLAPDTQLPVGLQIMAPAFADDRLYRVGAAFEAGQ